MDKKIYIINGSGGKGKDSFAEAVGRYVATYKYSSIDLVKDMFEFAGIPKEPKTEEKRLLYSDTKDRLTQYDDIPFKDVASVVADFKNDLIDTDILLIDIREPKEIRRAVESFGAETILIRNPNVTNIVSNHADANVEQYHYDYIIENNGTIEQLYSIAKEFVEYVVKKERGMSLNSHIIFEPYDKKKTLVFLCNKVVR